MADKNWASELGLKSVGKIFRNLPYEDLYKHEIENNEVHETNLGAVSVDTGKFTGRSPKDRYIVKREPSSNHIAWGKINKPVSEEIFDELFEVAKEQLNGKDLYVTDVYSGSNEKDRKAIRFVSEMAWQSHFVSNMFIRPVKTLDTFSEDFTVYNACHAVNEKWKEHGLNSEVFVIFDIERKVAIIGGTYYGGEMKKGIFSMMNYWLPLENIMTMHCSANIGEKDDVALFFGLSGTGKTTLSTDPKRRLIGDDEHGWDDEGVFNFEGGCYAKTISLDKDSEPEIYGAIKRDALLENVVINDGVVDFDSSEKTENTRVSYPITHIENHEKTMKGGHPKEIIFLSYDAFGVLPPVAKLTKEQAMYYFLSGYTAKVAGTERGITEPTTTFSACFGEAFMTLHPTDYAKLLGEKIEEHDVSVYLINTGITGGPYGGGGKRMSIKATRACVNAILDGSIKNCSFHKMAHFNIEVPETLEGVPTELLDPRDAWEDKEAYDKQAHHLAELFVENFKRFKASKTDLVNAGPTV
ncbi:MAG: phosphoenolpyruvate carboxykinase (ATP) [Campylobacterales bacterium]|nr:phosphoenolpyruvate carboxykinase (ATP) [Campylobacterales bacterium]